MPFFHPRLSYRASVRGFSLIEICVVVGIIGILLAIGIPNFVQYRSNQTMRTTLDTLVGEARLARQTARDNADGVAFSGAVAPVSPPLDGAIDVRVFSVANGAVNQLIGETTINAGFTSGGKNLLAPGAVTSSNATVGGLVVFTGHTGQQQVLAFLSNGTPLNGAACGVTLANNALTLQMLVSAQGDVKAFQNDNPGIPLDQQILMSASPSPF